MGIIIPLQISAGRLEGVAGASVTKGLLGAAREVEGACVFNQV